MKNSISVYQQPMYEVTENQINALAERLPAIMKIQGDTDGQREQLITESYYHIKAIEVITSAVQGTIDDIKRILLPALPAFQAVDEEAVAKEKLEKGKSTLVEKEIQLAELTSRLQLFPVDPVKSKRLVLLYVFMIIVAGVDLTLAYTSAQAGGFNVFISALYALLAAVLITSTHFIIAPFINAARTQKTRTIRTILTVLLGILFFTFMGNVRTQALTEVDISIGGSASEYAVNTWMMPIVGFLLFVIILLFSLQVHRSTLESKNQSERDKLNMQINKIIQEIDLLKKEIEAIPQTVIAQKQQARELYYYYQTAVKRCVHIASQAIVAYKNAYVSARPDMETPCFMQEPVHFTFDTAININELKTEVV